MAKWVKIAVGAALIAGTLLSGGALAPALASFLISAGTGLVLSGIGSLLSKGPLQGISTATRNPIAPWNVLYGRGKLGGTIVYINQWGSNNAWIDLIIVLNCHKSKSVDALQFDGQRVALDSHGCSFTPTQISRSISSIVRSNDVVTVILSSAITTLQTGDSVHVRDVSGDLTLNGRFPIQLVSSTKFTYICGGAAASVSGSGTVDTLFPDFGSKVYMEALLGGHSATFTGMLNGTPNDGDTGNLVGPSPNPWTSAHKLLGKTAVFMRLHYDDKYFSNGLPAISFLVSGKNDIADPRTSPITYGYTENPALCIADYLSNTAFGFKANYGTEIPIPQLNAGANICDESVSLAASGVEPRYTCNGGFPITMKRGEVLQNLLTACGGRLTYTGGQFLIQPAAWGGLAHTIGTGAWQLGAPIIVPASAGTFVLDWEDQVGGGDQSFGNGTVRIIFDGLGGATIEYLGTRGFTSYTDNYGVATSLGNNGAALVGRSAGAGPVAIPNVPAVGLEMLVCIFSPDGVFYSGPPSHNSDHVAHAYLSAAPANYFPIALPILATFSGPFRWRSKVSSRDLYNGVKGTYISPFNNWQSSDVPPYAQDSIHGYSSDANLAADGGDRRWFDVQLPFTISPATAQRLCKIELLRRRQQGTGTFALSMAGYQITALDIVSMTVGYLSWTAKTLEVLAHRFTLDRQHGDSGEVTLLGTEIDVQETDPSVYDWSTTEELTARGYQQGTLPSNVGTLDDMWTVNGT